MEQVSKAGLSVKERDVAAAAMNGHVLSDSNLRMHSHAHSNLIESKYKLMMFIGVGLNGLGVKWAMTITMQISIPNRFLHPDHQHLRLQELPTIPPPEPVLVNRMHRLVRSPPLLLLITIPITADPVIQSSRHLSIIHTIQTKVRITSILLANIIIILAHIHSHSHSRIRMDTILMYKDHPTLHPSLIITNTTSRNLPLTIVIQAIPSKDMDRKYTTDTAIIPIITEK